MLLLVPGLLALLPAQTCTPEWLPFLGEASGASSAVRSLHAADLGAGPALYAGGGFERIDGVPARGIARFDGQRWSPLGSGVAANFAGSAPGQVLAIETFDGGDGPKLYAAGGFQQAGAVPAVNIARWDGEAWSSLFTVPNGLIRALLAHDDGQGPGLFAAGDFTALGQVSYARIARWNGSQWSAVGDGFSGSVRALAEFDGGSGAELIAGGNFTSAGGGPANFVARWDGAVWSPLLGGSGDGLAGGLVESLIVHDGGGGAALYAGGDFTSADGAPALRIARWDGANWSAVGDGLNAPVRGLTSADFGQGAELFAVGAFVNSAGSPMARAARWDGAAWSPLGGGLTGGSFPTGYAVAALDLGFGKKLHVGGQFTDADALRTPNHAVWDGDAWELTSSGLAGGVLAATVYSGSGAPALYLGGSFTHLNATPAANIGRWDGVSFSALGDGIDGIVTTLAVFDEGQGPRLFAAGRFETAGGVAVDHIARWDGSVWSPVGTGLTMPAGTVRRLQVLDAGDGPALYVGGQFSSAGGQPGTERIARWDGQQWSAIGDGLNGAHVNSMLVGDIGRGPELFISGSFTSSGSGQVLNRVARLAGGAWTPLGSGLTGNLQPGSGVEVFLTVFDAGDGPQLHAAGNFVASGGQSLSGLAYWNGTAWAPYGPGADAPPTGIGRVSVGGQEQLVVSGNFSAIAGQSIERFARFNGAAWLPLGPSSGGVPRLLDTLEFGGASLLYATGGHFGSAGQGDSTLGRFGCHPAPSALPGCFGNSAQLQSPTPYARLGEGLTVRLTQIAHPVGWAALFVGLDGSDTGGCGLFLPGLGEFLLAPLPAPVTLAQGPTTTLAALFELGVPKLPALVGAKLTFQAAHAAALPGTPVELSSGLVVPFVP